MPRNQGRRYGGPDSGIEVHEEEWGTVTVQQLYKVRCECGRSWFEPETPKFVRCLACHKLGLVSRQRSPRHAAGAYSSFRTCQIGNQTPERE